MHFVGNTVIPSYNGSYKGSGPEGQYPKIKDFCDKNGIKCELVVSSDPQVSNFKIDGWPTSYLLKNGEIVDKFVGALTSDSIIEGLNRNL